MSKHSIMKNLDSEPLMQTADGFRATFSDSGKKFGVLKFCSLFIVVAAFICAGFILTKLNIGSIETDETISLVSAPIASTASKKDVITIPTGLVKANPFVPYRSLGNESTSGLVNDVPKFDLIAPPEDMPADTESAKIMETVVSGILYDKFSPSAILNIGGNDYLVKKGDTVSNYKILAIAKDSVTVKVGTNTYTAGIGQLLTEGSVNYNNVSNLSKKFGGEKR